MHLSSVCSFMAAGWASWLLCLAALGPGALAQLPISSCNRSRDGASLYDYSATHIDEKTEVFFKDYRGKVVIVVNVATYWGT